MGIFAVYTAIHRTRVAPLRHGPPELYSYTALSILTLYISLYSYTSLYTLYNLYTTHTQTPLPWRQGAEDLGSAGIVQGPGVGSGIVRLVTVHVCRVCARE